MDQETIGQRIRELRRKHHLTQASFAEKYHVTYQAVSKWETGKNMPDIALLKQICEDFDIQLEEVLEGQIIPRKQKNLKRLRGLLVIIIIILLCLLGITLFQDNNFEFKTVSANCDTFKISGSLAYNRQKSNLYLSNIEQCGEKDHTAYDDIVCTLYEKQGNTITALGQVEHTQKKKTTLSQFLTNITFHLDNFSNQCSTYSEDSLYLEIKATDSNNKVTTYQIPLSLSACNN